MNQNRYLPEGTKLQDRYLLENVIGEGAFGIIYLARDMENDRKVAIKEYFPTGKVCRKISTGEVCPLNAEEEEWITEGIVDYLEKAGIMKSYTGESGCVRVFDVFAENSTGYMVMEYLSGGSLKEHLKKLGKVAPDEAIRLLYPVMGFLMKLHGDKRIHCDISPDNLMFDGAGNLRIIDFGALYEKGKCADEKQLKDGYAPLELYQNREDVGPWTDVYSLCAVWYEMLCGCKPDKAPNRGIKDTVKSPSEYVMIGKRKEQALMQGISIDIQKRFFSMANLADALQTADDEMRSQLTKVRSAWGDVWIRITTEVERNNWKQLADNNRRRRIRQIFKYVGAVLLVIGICAAGLGWYVKENPDKVLDYYVERDRQQFAGENGFVPELAGTPEYEADAAFLKEYGTVRSSGEAVTMYELPAAKIDEWNHATNDTWKSLITKDTFLKVLEYHTADSYVKSGRTYLSQRIWLSEKELSVFFGYVDTYQCGEKELRIQYDKYDSRVTGFTINGAARQEVGVILEEILPYFSENTHFGQVEVEGLLSKVEQREDRLEMITLNEIWLTVSETESGYKVDIK